MKNQYIGDIGDYGKYGLLRYLSSQGIKIGVNWYLTPNDERTDGLHTGYLNMPEMKDYDPELFMKMKELAPIAREEKTVQMVEESGLFSGFIFYHEKLNTDDKFFNEREAERERWHQNALRQLEGAKLVFVDPDNGLVRKMRTSRKGSHKYISREEIKDYFEAGKDVVYYHHRSRKNDEGWMQDKTIMKDLAGVRLLAVSAHRWGNRAYIFVVHEKNYEFYRNIIEEFLKTRWGERMPGKRMPFFTIEDVQ
ncbi:MAG: hypothetical protein K6E30_07275 [Lachnospiraceae bacterium]|nr:hypothetical protein [Lachnospiraceae bacterium]